jgi:hypothetical protein
MEAVVDAVHHRCATKPCSLRGMLVVHLAKGESVNRVMFVIVLAGCGSESAVDKCDNLVDTLCDRAVTCVPGNGNHATCVASVQTALPCGSAKTVSASYDRCMSQLESSSCSVLFPTNPQTGETELSLPADCNAVILSREQFVETDLPPNAMLDAVINASRVD